jgi:hypothetical protein
MQCAFSPRLKLERLQVFEGVLDMEGLAQVLCWIKRPKRQSLRQFVD